MNLDEEQRALVQLGRDLLRTGYRFVAPTPETHRRAVARRQLARGLRDVFGWSLPFQEGDLPTGLVELLAAAGALERSGEQLRSAVRFSTLGATIYAHSAYPTTAPDAVFFGPDTYRYCALLEERVLKARRCVDVGAGAGAGGIHLAGRCDRVVLSDVNSRALRLAAANATLAGVEVEIARSDVLRDVEGPFDLVVANPPYLADPMRRAYRDGGSPLGAGLTLRIASEALERLAPGGRLVVYSASAIVDGEDLLRRALEPLLRRTRYDYRELDPDVFGEELERPEYASVERIAVVALDATKEG